jgi:hypothetical protein
VFVDQKVTINRRLVGCLALVFLVGAGIMFATEDSSQGGSADLWQNILFRVGMVLATFWMALPKDGSLGKWAEEVSMTKLLVIVVAIVMFVRAPRQYLPILLAIAAAARFLRPPEKPRPPRAFS